MHNAMDMLNRSWEDNSNSTNDDFRGMDDEENEQLGFAPEYDIFPIVLAILIIAANSHALLLIGKVRSLQTATNVMLGSLAISDLLNGSLGIPLYLVCTATQEAAVCSTSQLFVKFISISISSHLLLVSVDRYIAIVHALRYHSLVTKRKVHCLLIATWLTAIFVSVIQLSWVASTKTELTISRVQIIYVSVTMVVFFAAPLVTMIICYITIFRALRSQLKDIARNSIPSYSRKKETAFMLSWKASNFCFYNDDFYLHCLLVSLLLVKYSKRVWFI